MLDDPELDEESESLLEPESDDEDDEDEFEEDPELESLDESAWKRELDVKRTPNRTPSGQCNVSPSF